GVDHPPPEALAHQPRELPCHDAPRTRMGAERAVVGGAGDRLPPLAPRRLPLGDLPDRAGDLPPVVLHRARDALLGPRRLLRLALPLRRAPGPDHPRRPAAWREAGGGTAGAARAALGHQVRALRGASRALVLFHARGAGHGGGGALQDRDLAAHVAGLALRSLCPRASRRRALHRAVLLPF